ncbi:MAG: cohesin domain-containing protein [Nitrospirota bacterium]|nr:cohesin domain-containing protein [Nitrospirota bacterium]
MSTRFFYSATEVLLLLAMSISAFASAGISVSSSGGGAYSIDGAAFDRAAAIELTLTYDRGALSNPRVIQGPLLSGALVAVNPNTPGVIRIAAVTTMPISGGGGIASVVFDTHGSSGGVTSVSARLSALNGSALPVLASVVNPGVSPTTPQGEDSPGAAPAEEMRTTATLPAVVVSGGAVAVSGEADRTVDRGDPEAIPGKADAGQDQPEPIMLAAREPSPLKKPAAPEAAQARKIYTQQGVLEKFRKYQGVRSRKALVSLFEQDGMIGYRQEPAIALSDGKKTVKAIFIAPADLNGKPDIAIAGARLVSLDRHPDFTNTWVADLLPYKNASEAAITVPLTDLIMILPVTIAPPAKADLDRSGGVTEEDFGIFLSATNAERNLASDLNGDGRRDYYDDFIFTANYLMRMEAAAGKKESPRQGPERR